MLSTFLFVLFGVLFPEDSGSSPLWAGFLGPTTPEVSETSIPLAWSPTEHVAWEKELDGYGQSSPVVWGDRVYVSSVSGKMKETLQVAAFDVQTGERVWVFSMPTKNQGENTDYYSRAAPTPIVSKHGVCVFFENGDLISLTHVGTQLWHRDLVAEMGPITSRHGLASSVVALGDLVMVWVQRDQDPYLMCVQQATGEMVWKESLPTGTTWSSPTLIEMVDGSQHLVLSVGGSGGGGSGGGGAGRGGLPRSQEGSNAGSETPQAAPPIPTPGRLIGIEPLSGKRLWELEGLTGNSTPTPTRVAPGEILVGASAGREGGPTKEAIATNGLVSIKKEGDGWSAEYVWRSERATCGFCSPIAHQGLCYFVDRRGRLFCLDAETGKEIYSENLGHPVWATPLAVGSRIYFVGEEGSTTVIAAGTEFRKLASNQLWESAEAPVDENNPRSMLGRTRQYAVAAIPNALLIRRGDRLYCLRP